MFNIFNSNVFVEIGEAIGNVGQRLFPRPYRARAMDEAFRRYLLDPLPLSVSNQPQRPVKPEEIVIEGSFRCLDEEDHP
jgi:hypothetical protein